MRRQHRLLKKRSLFILAYCLAFCACKTKQQQEEVLNSQSDEMAFNGMADDKEIDEVYEFIPELAQDPDSETSSESPEAASLGLTGRSIVEPLFPPPATAGMRELKRIQSQVLQIRARLEISGPQVISGGQLRALEALHVHGPRSRSLLHLQNRGVALFPQLADLLDQVPLSQRGAFTGFWDNLEKAPSEKAVAGMLQTIASWDTFMSQMTSTARQVTKTASDGTFAPALLNSPLTAVAASPLIRSQLNGTLPSLKDLTSRGALSGVARTGFKYGIGDTVGGMSQSFFRQARDDGRLPKEMTDAEIASYSRVVSAISMSYLTQPFLSYQIARQTGKTSSEAAQLLLPNMQAAKKAWLEGASWQQAWRAAMPRPFRGATPSFFSAQITLELNAFNKSLAEQVGAGTLRKEEATAYEMVAGATAGVANNLIKSIAALRSQGVPLSEIQSRLVATAQKNPRVFLGQALYSAALGSGANKLWAETTHMLKYLDETLEQRLPQSKPAPALPAP